MVKVVVKVVVKVMDMGKVMVMVIVKEVLEPEFWNFEKDGLFCDWFPRKPIVKNEIDTALKKLFGKDWNKPFSLSKNGRTEFKRVGKTV